MMAEKRSVLMLGSLVALVLTGWMASGLSAQRIDVPIQTNIAQPRNVPEFSQMVRIEPVAISDQDDELTRLHKLRLNSALTELALRHNIYRQNLDGDDDLINALRRVYMAGIELYTDRATQETFLQRSLEYLTQLERYVEPFSRVDTDAMADREALRYQRLSIEIALRKLAAR